MKYLKKSIVIFTIVFLSMTFFLSPITYSQAPANTQGTNEISDPLANYQPNAFDYILGAPLYLVKVLFIVPGLLANIILSGVANIGGTTGAVTIESILFNEIAITNIDFFNPTSGNMTTISENIGAFYYSIRNLAIALSLAVLVYIGLHMAINSSASAQAKYKQMLTDWVVGFGIIFILHYFMAAVIKVSNLLVDALKGSAIDNSDLMSELLLHAWDIPFTTSLACGILYLVLLGFTFIFLIMYIKRMITVAFLMVIAPLISVTYSIDKIDNNRSEILDTWLREFLYNVLIQPFHCLIYASMVGISMQFISNGGAFNFGAIVFGIIMTSSIFFFEKIIKEIFGFKQSRTLAEKVAMGAIITNTVSNIKNVAAIKNSVEDISVNKKLKNMPDKMPDGTDVNPQNILKYKHDAEARKSAPKGGEQKGESGIPTGGSNPTGSGTYNANRKNRRPARNVKSPKLRRAIRGYGRTFATMSGINYGKQKYKNHKVNQAKREVAGMSQRELFEAYSENYRQMNNLSNEDMVKEMDRIYNSDISDLKDPSEIIYKAFMENNKKAFSKNGRNPLDEMKKIYKA